jgi:tRNA(fMet)-specific endonuclease VapC
MDLRIAAIAIANQMTLLTQNTVDFERIPGLQIDDWLV